MGREKGSEPTMQRKHGVDMRRVGEKVIEARVMRIALKMADAVTKTLENVGRRGPQGIIDASVLQFQYLPAFANNP